MEDVALHYLPTPINATPYYIYGEIDKNKPTCLFFHDFIGMITGKQGSLSPNPHVVRMHTMKPSVFPIKPCRYHREIHLSIANAVFSAVKVAFRACKRHL